MLVSVVGPVGPWKIVGEVAASHTVSYIIWWHNNHVGEVQLRLELLEFLEIEVSNRELEGIPNVQ